MNEEMNKALRYFGREDLTDGLYENNIDDNVQVFLTIRQMIKLYNLQSKIDRAIEFVEKENKICYTNKTTDSPQKVIGNFMWHTDKLLNILKEN